MQPRKCSNDSHSCDIQNISKRNPPITLPIDHEYGFIVVQGKLYWYFCGALLSKHFETIIAF